MEFTPKLANIVILGSFNPGILTVDFLQNTCKIPLKDSPKALQNPIESVVTSGNVTFVASLERFEISEIDLKDFETTKINEYVKPYLDTLKYTPVQACGMNLNVDIKDLDLKILQKYFIEDHPSLAKILNAEELTIRNDFKFSKGKEEVDLYSVKYLIKSSEINGNIRIKANLDKSYNFKYNYEIRNKNGFGLIIDQYQNRIKDFNSFIQEIGQHHA